MRTCSFACSVVLAAGISASASRGQEPVTRLEPDSGRVGHAAHIYYNLASGERVVTLEIDGRVSGADTGDSESVWASLTPSQCAGHGLTSEFFFGLDDPGTSSLSTAAMLVDYGDIAHDTVVDCVRINWVTAHADRDEDSDGVGDGVLGLAGQWIWWDLENGRPGDACIRMGLVGFTFWDLPGHLGFEDELSSYTADIDLAATFTGTSLTFEICDTDSDRQGAAVHNPGIGVMDRDLDGAPDSDLDGDGLSDWGWSVRFYQPGTVDFDSDGSPDGVPAPPDRDVIGVRFGAPDGEAVEHGDGTWSWLIDTGAPDAGTGQEDRFVPYTGPDQFGEIAYAGGYDFGGFSCTVNAPGESYRPSAMFEHQLLGPGQYHHDCGDLNGDGVINFFDVSYFLQAFARGDLVVDYSGDGILNFFDVSIFLSIFIAGCP